MEGLKSRHSQFLCLDCRSEAVRRRLMCSGRAKQHAGPFDFEAKLPITSRKSNQKQRLGAVASGSRCPMARLEGGFSQQFSFQNYDPIPYTSNDYQGAKYRMGMGLAPMKPEALIEIDEEYENDIKERRSLLKTVKDTVIHSIPEAADANRELLEVLSTYLTRQFPDRFTHLADNKLVNHATGDIWDLENKSLDPLEVCSLLVQEDLCLMMKDKKGELKFVSGAVLFPQRWSLIEKIGMNMSRIHMPVPLYEETISRPVGAFMERLDSSRPYARANWTITDNPAKFQPLDEEALQARIDMSSGAGHPEDEPVTFENAGRRLCTRMERETLSRLPKSGAILFTIKTYIKPLSRFANQPEKARQLARAIRNLDPSVAEYKTMYPFREKALSFLDGIVASA